MADGTTLNHSFILPEIGSSKDTWGTKLNNNFTFLDSLLRTSANSVFLPRSGGGSITGPLIFSAHDDYTAWIGHGDFPLSVRRKSDNAIAFRFDGDAGLGGNAPDARSVLNRAMGDARFMRPDQPTTFLANSFSQLLVAHPTRVFAVRRKSDGMDTHNIFDADIIDPDVASGSRSILTRIMGDRRYLTLTGGNTVSGAQTYSGEARYTGVKDGTIAIGGATTTPFYATRSSDGLVTHVILDADLTSPDVPSHARSLLTRTMGDARYPQKGAPSTFTADQTFDARAVFDANNAARVYIGQAADSPLYVARKSDVQITHYIPNADIASPDSPSQPRSILTRTMGDGRYGMLGVANAWAGYNRFDDQLVSAGNTTANVILGGGNALAVARKSDGVVTHAIAPGDITTPLTPTSPASILTRQMGDSRYVTVSATTEGPITITKAGSGRVDIGSSGVAVQTGGADQASLVYHMRSRNAALTDVFRVFANGNVQNTNNSYAGLSDSRLKENIVDAGPQLEDLLALQVRHFNMRHGDKRKQIGLIAQEVQQIKPGLVEVDPEGMLSVKYSVLVPILLKAIQELTAEVRRNSPVTTGA